MSYRRCVYDCRHPLWGGDGTCLNQHEGPSLCSCDAGFASRDALGQASCVPTRVLTTGYLVLAAASFLTTVLLVHHLRRYRHLPQASRCLPKTVTRLRVLLSGSFYIVGVGIIGVALAVRGGRTNVNDAGVVQALYIALLPSAMFFTAVIAEFWVASLPIQFLPPDSIARKLRSASDEHHVFIIIGCLNAGGISSLGFMSIFVPFWPQLISDGASVFGVLIAMATIIFVAVQLTRYITQASLKVKGVYMVVSRAYLIVTLFTLIPSQLVKEGFCASPHASMFWLGPMVAFLGAASGDAFYDKARRNVWRQASAMCSVCIYIVVVILIKRLTTIGRGTPIIAWTLQALSCHMGSGIFAMATKFEQPVALLRRSRATGSRLSSRRRSSFIAAFSPAAQQFLNQLKPSGWQIVEVGGYPCQHDPICEAHAEEPKRRGSVQWAEAKEEESAHRTSLTTNAAKVLPI